MCFNNKEREMFMTKSGQDGVQHHQRGRPHGGVEEGLTNQDFDFSKALRFEKEVETVFDQFLKQSTLDRFFGTPNKYF